MVIVTTTELVAFKLKYVNKEADVESLRQNACHILSKNRNVKIKDKLSKEQGKALKEIRQINNDTKVYQFDKCSGFVILSEGNVIEKIEEQLGKAKVTDEDPTQKYTSKIQIRNTFKYNLQIRLHHGYMKHLKLTNQKRTIPCALLYQQLEHHPMELLSICLK